MKLAATGIIALCCITPSTQAQLLHVETGGGEARLDQLRPSSLAAFGGGLDALFGRAHFQFDARADEHIGLGVAGAMSGGIHYRFEPAGFRIEVGPVSEAARGIGERWSSAFAGDVNASRDVGRFTLRAGWQQGVVRSGSQRASWRRPAASVQAHFGVVQVGATWQSTFVQDSVLRSNAFLSPLDLRADTLYRSDVRDIQDLGVKAAWRGDVLSLDGRLGRRWGASITPQTWWEGRAALKVTPIVSLTLRMGHLASDALLSVRGGQYTTFGLRLDIPQRTRNAERSAAMQLAQVVRESATSVRILFTMPAGTRQVTLASDLTEWRGVPLTRTDDGRWEIILPATAGVHRVNISTDSGPWRVPPGLPAMEDGFGAKVGLLVLER